MSDSTIGDNPLDSVIPETEGDTEKDSEPAENRSNGTTGEKKRMTIHLPEELTERIKNAVYWTPGLTISDLATEALSRIMEELEEENGEKFPPRDQELKGGRPLE